MVGKLIKIASANYTISAVDVDRQELTVSSAVSPVGSGLTYSIQDTFEVDPKWQYILEFFPDTQEAGKDIEVEYYCYQTPLSGDDDETVIPEKYHFVIVNKASLIYGAMDGSELFDREMYKELYMEGVTSMMNTEDPLDMAYDFESEPDITRLAGSSIVR
jgi:hypothetical protein